MKKTMKYNLGRGLKALVAGALMFGATSCDKEEIKPNPQPTPSDKHYNVELKMDGSRGYPGIAETITDSLLYAHQTNSQVDTILLIPYNDWSWIRGPNEQTYIINAMKYIRQNYSKSWGRGDFNFYPGDISESDSLWLVQNGWTLNKDLQR